jgi:hypothetical protein
MSDLDLGYELGRAAVVGSLSYLGSGYAGATFEKVRQELTDPSDEENEETLEYLQNRHEEVDEPIYVALSLYYLGREHTIRKELDILPEGQKKQKTEEWKYTIEQLED